MIEGMRTAEICAGMVLMVAAGCATWRDRPVTAPTPTHGAADLRVTTNRGARRLTLEGATVRRDSVVGLLAEAADRRGDDWVTHKVKTPRQRVAIAAGDVWSLEEEQLSWSRTAVLLGVVAAVVIAVGYAATAAALASAN